METIIWVGIFFAICYLIRVLDQAVCIGRRLEEKAEKIDGQLGIISARVEKIEEMVCAEGEEGRRRMHGMGTEESGPLLGDIKELE